MSKLIYASFIGAALVLGIAAPPAEAADPGFCRRYAAVALNQVRTALSLPGCRRGMEGSRWSADFRVHFDWCLREPFGAAEAERGIRTRHLQACRRI